MATVTVSTRFYTAAGAALVSPVTAPTFSQVRKDTDAIVASGNLTESANAAGLYWTDLTTVDGLEYLIVLDGDPIAAGQTAAGPPRFAIGHISGTSEERQRVDIPAILVDTGTTLPAEHALLEAEADALTRANTNQTEHDATQVAIAAIPAAPSAGAIADQVWDEARSGHVAAGSFGESMQDLLYEGGSVWLASGGSAGSVVYTNGTKRNPSGTFADAVAIANSLGLKRISIVPAAAFTTLTLDAIIDGFEIIGPQGESFPRIDLDAGTFSYAFARFKDCIVFNGLGSIGAFLESGVYGESNGATNPWLGGLNDCTIQGTVQLSAGSGVNNARGIDGQEADAALATFDLLGAASNIQFTRLHGAFRFQDWLNTGAGTTEMLIHCDGAHIVFGADFGDGTANARVKLVGLGSYEMEAGADFTLDASAFVWGGPEDKYQGAVHLDLAAANTGTLAGIDGTPHNPVSTEAAARTLLDALNLKTLVVAGDADFGTLTLTQAWREYQILAKSGSGLLGGGPFLDVDGQDIRGTTIRGFVVSTTTVYGSTLDAAANFSDCRLANWESRFADYTRCRFTGTLRGGGTFYDCSFVRDSLGNPCYWEDAPDFTGGAEMVDCAGALELRNWTIPGTGTMSIDGFKGDLTIAATVTGTPQAFDVSGVGNFTDLSALAVDRTGFVNAPDIRRILGHHGEFKKVAVLTKVLTGPGKDLPLTQRVRVYDTLANYTTDDGVTGLLDEQSVTATYTGNSMDTYESNP